MMRADEDTEEYEENTEEYVNEYTRMEDYEKEKVRVDAGRGMKRSRSEVYVNEDVDVRCIPPALVEQKRSRQQMCASSEEQLAFVPSDGPEGESLSVPIIPSSRTNCRPSIRKE